MGKQEPRHAQQKRAGRTNTIAGLASFMTLALAQALALALATPTLAQNVTEDITQETYTPPPVAAFARLPAIRDIEVSPDGQHVAAFLEINGNYTFVVIKLTPGASPELVYALSSTADYRVNWSKWTSADRLILSTRFAAERYRTPTTETRLLSIRPDGSDMRLALHNRSGARPLQIQDDVVDFRPLDPDHIYLQYDPDFQGEPGVYRVNVVTGRTSRVQRGRGNIRDWISDPSGEIRVGEGVENNRRQVMMMKTSDGNWRDFDHRVQQEGVSFWPWGFVEGSDLLYVASNHETPTMALYTFDIDEDAFVDQIFAHPQFDVSHPIRNHDQTQILGVSYGDGVHWFDPSRPNEHRQLRKALGMDAGIIDETPDGRFAVVAAGNDLQPTTYFLYDRQENNVIYIDAKYPDLTNRPLGPVIEVSYAARDGLEIPGYITLPPWVPSLEDAKDLPFILHPHGGPTARDFRRFDYLTQYFASRGYGVLQMNFRGSEGYGTNFQAAGDRAWGQEMQDDITDGAQWLVDLGHANPDKLAIMGWSYGGYAALMGAVKTPDLYQCAISVNGATDLPDQLDHWNNYVDGEYWSRHMGRMWKDRVMLRENSPARRADDITMPILLVHGTEDRTVPFDQAQKMARAMRRNDVDHTFIELENGDHSLTSGANRLRMMEEMDAFLAECLG